MKLSAIFLTCLISIQLVAQEKNKDKTKDKFGNTLNIGLGVGYFTYIGNNPPVLHANFEFDVFKNFTLAPFISVFSYKNYFYWGNNNYANQRYYYRQTAIPIGIKGTYYFDQLLKAGNKWDFYLAGTLGAVFYSTTWEAGYYGEREALRSDARLFIDAHIGTEFHINKQLGLFLDLSTTISTFGLSIHL